MKNTTKAVFVLFFSVCCITAAAQDIISKTNGDEIAGKIVKITKKNIKYRMASNEGGSLRSIPKRNVSKVVYEDGDTKEFNPSQVDDKDQEGHWDKRSMRQQGKEDAQDYYRRWHGAKAAGSIGGFIGGPIIGLIPTIVASSTPPKHKRLGYPDGALMQNPDYARAYRREAHRIKRGKTWGGYAFGVILEVAVVVVIAIL